LARAGFVLNQIVDRHGCATNVVKTPRNVVKSVVKTRVRRNCAMDKPLPAERGERRMGVIGKGTMR
jgi:hypothetical protein